MKGPIIQTSLKKFQWVPPYCRERKDDVPCGICALGQLNILQTLDVVLPGAHTVHSTQPSLLFYPPLAVSLRTRNTVFLMEPESTVRRKYFPPFCFPVPFSLHTHARLSHLICVHQHAGPVCCYRISERFNKLITYVPSTCLSVHGHMHPKPVCLILETYKYAL